MKNKDCILSTGPQNANFWRSITKKCEFLLKKIQCKNVISQNIISKKSQKRTESNYQNHCVMVCESWRWYYQFDCGATSSKSDKKGLNQHPNSTTSRDWFFKNVNFYPQNFNAKIDWLSFLFVVVCETRPWYYRFCRGTSFPRSYKKDWIL